MMHPDC